MKLLAAFLAALALGALAQSTSTPVVIKREGCFAAGSLVFSPNGSEQQESCNVPTMTLKATIAKRWRYSNSDAITISPSRPSLACIRYPVVW